MLLPRAGFVLVETCRGSPHDLIGPEGVSTTRAWLARRMQFVCFKVTSFIHGRLRGILEMPCSGLPRNRREGSSGGAVCSGCRLKIRHCVGPLRCRSDPTSPLRMGWGSMQLLALEGLLPLTSGSNSIEPLGDVRPIESAV